MQETPEMQVGTLNWEDPLEKGMATHSSILAWTLPCTEKPGGYSSCWLQRVGHNWSYAARHSLELLIYNVFLGKNAKWVLNIWCNFQCTWFTPIYDSPLPGNILLHKSNLKDNLTDDHTNTNHVVVRNKGTDITHAVPMSLHNTSAWGGKTPN